MSDDPIFYDLTVLPEAACDCERCQSWCRDRRPGAPTPEEADRLMDQGLASRLALDHYWMKESDGDHLPYLAPAPVGYEGKMYPTWPRGRCTFYGDDGKCEVHNSGAKPLVCRISTCTDPLPDEMRGKDFNYSVAHLWDNDRGREVVARWRKETGCDETPELTIEGALDILFGFLDSINVDVAGEA